LKAVYQAASRALSLEFTLPASARIRLSLYGVEGRLLQTMALDRNAGSQKLIWPLSGGRSLPGLRFIRLDAGALVFGAKVFAGE
jgi:hypothetical protein